MAHSSGFEQAMAAHSGRLNESAELGKRLEVAAGRIFDPGRAGFVREPENGDGVGGRVG